jgi:hypothetical protein
MLRIPQCLDIRLTDGGKVVSPTHRQNFTSQKHYYFYVMQATLKHEESCAIMLELFIGTRMSKYSNNTDDRMVYVRTWWQWTLFPTVDGAEPLPPSWKTKSVMERKDILSPLHQDLVLRQEENLNLLLWLLFCFFDYSSVNLSRDVSRICMGSICHLASLFLLELEDSHEGGIMSKDYPCIRWIHQAKQWKKLRIADNRSEIRKQWTLGTLPL